MLLTFLQANFAAAQPVSNRELVFNRDGVFRGAVFVMRGVEMNGGSGLEFSVEGNATGTLHRIIIGGCGTMPPGSAISVREWRPEDEAIALPQLDPTNEPGSGNPRSPGPAPISDEPVDTNPDHLVIVFKDVDPKLNPPKSLDGVVVLPVPDPKHGITRFYIIIPEVVDVLAPAHKPGEPIKMADELPSNSLNLRAPFTMTLGGSGCRSGYTPA